jgi:hypothetical protein
LHHSKEYLPRIRSGEGALIVVNATSLKEGSVLKVKNTKLRCVLYAIGGVR